MGLTGFLSSFGKEKIKDVQSGFIQKLVAWDPETASRAEIEEVIKELDNVTLLAGKARADYVKERDEAAAARANYDKHMAAAELLNKRIQNGEQGLDQSLEGLVGKLEELRPEVEREEQAAKEAEAYFNELKEVATATADKLKTAKEILSRAQRDMKMAEIEKQRADQRAERAEVAAGLKKNASNLGVALDSMQKQAADMRAKAEASTMKADLLSDVKKEDPNIAEALKAVSGEPAIKGNAADRLAALRK